MTGQFYYCTSCDGTVVRNYRSNVAENTLNATTGGLGGAVVGGAIGSLVPIVGTTFFGLLGGIFGFGAAATKAKRLSGGICDSCGSRFEADQLASLRPRGVSNAEQIRLAKRFGLVMDRRISGGFTNCPACGIAVGVTAPSCQKRKISFK